jgi:hypothetical protein
MMWLQYAGRPLRDELALGDYGIAPNSTIELQLRLRGGKRGQGDRRGCRGGKKKQQKELGLRINQRRSEIGDVIPERIYTQRASNSPPRRSIIDRISRAEKGGGEKKRPRPESPPRTSSRAQEREPKRPRTASPLPSPAAEQKSEEERRLEELREKRKRLEALVAKEKK